MSRKSVFWSLTLILGGIMAAPMFLTATSTLQAAAPSADPSSLVQQADTILSNNNASPSDRNRALDMLACAGQQGIPILAREIVKDNQYFAEGAAERLRKLGPAGVAAAIDALQQLDDAGFNLKSPKVLLALGRESLPAVAAGLHGQPRMRNAIINDMAGFYIGKQLTAGELALIRANVEPLSEQLDADAAALSSHSAFPDVAPALTLLDAIGADARPAVPALMNLLVPGDSSRLMRICQTLASIGPDAAAAAMQPIDDLQSAPEITGALRGLGTCGIEPAALMITGDEGVHRDAALDALLQIAGDIRAAVKSDGRPLPNPDDVSALAAAGEETPDIYTPSMPPQAHAALVRALPVFISLIEDPKNGSFQNTIAVLPLLGTDARGAVDAVVAQFGRADVNVISCVLHAIDPEEADGIVRSHQMPSLLERRGQRLQSMISKPANKGALKGDRACGISPEAASALKAVLDRNYGGSLQEVEIIASLPIEQQRIVADQLLNYAKGPTYIAPDSSTANPRMRRPLPRQPSAGFELKQPTSNLPTKTIDGCAMSLGVINDIGLPVLQAMLESKDPRMHEPAAAAIGMADSPSAQTLKVIAIALDDPSPQTRVAAINSLIELILVTDAQKKQFDPQPLADEIQKLAADAADSSPAATLVRRRAIWALAMIKPPSAQSLQCLQTLAGAGDDSPITRQACMALARMGPDGLPVLLKLASSSAPEASHSLATTLQALPWARSRIQANLQELIGLRKASSANASGSSLTADRWQNVFNLSQSLGGDGAAIELAAFAQASAQHDASLEKQAEKSLAGQTIDALPSLAQALPDSRGSLRRAITDAMSSIVARFQPRSWAQSARFDQILHSVEPPLEQSCSDPDAAVRADVILALGFGDASATPELLQAAHDPDPSVRAAAAHGLSGRPSGVSPLKALLHDPNFSVRFAAALSLDPAQDPLAPAGAPPPLRFKDAVPVLEEAAKNPDPQIQKQAHAALERMKAK